MADLTSYIVLRKWNPTQLAEAAVTGNFPAEVWEPIGNADAATGSKAMEDVVEAAVQAGTYDAETAAQLELRAVPTRYWGEVQTPTVKTQTTVTVAPVSAPEQPAEPEPEQPVEAPSE